MRPGQTAVGATALAVGALVSSPALGAAVAFTSESAFLAAATPTVSESLEDESVTAHQPSQVTTYFTAHVSPLSGDYSAIIIGDPPGWASDGTHYLGGGGQSVVRLDLPSGEQFVMSPCPPCYPPHGAEYFFGVVSDTPFSAFSIINTAYGDEVAFDRMQFAPVPEPGTLALLALGLFGLGLTRRKVHEPTHPIGT